MQYRTFGQLDWQSSALGFGMMRLPLTSDDPKSIDEAQATQMVHYAIDHGVNYIDTAYAYHGGQSEPFVGRVLRDDYRERVRLATKLPCWLVKSSEDLDRFLDEQLERLQTSIDFYLLHGLNGESWARMQSLGVIAWAERAMSDERLGHLGFSFHDDLAAFRQIVDGYDGWTFCQIQHNYVDVAYQAGTRGLHYAADRGLAVVIMEPLRGGRLTKSTPEPIAALWASAERRRTPADWALQWLWNQPEVSVVLSGMSTMQHVTENVASADASGPGTLTAEELALVERVREAYERLCPVACTQCKYCLPCPSNVNIPRVLEIYNEAHMYEDLEGARRAYGWLKEQERANACTQCQECEELCPQHIAVSDWMKKAHELLSHDT